MKDETEVKLRKLHLIIGLISAIVVPIVGALISYHTAIANIDKRFVESRLESEQIFVKKEEYRRVEEKLDRISNDLGEIKGYLKKK